MRVPASLRHAYFIQGDAFKGPGVHGFTSRFPVTVVVAVDSRFAYRSIAPSGFAPTGRTVDFSGYSKRLIQFYLFSRSYPAGRIRFKFNMQSLGRRQRLFAGVFIKHVVMQPGAKQVHAHSAALPQQIWSGRVDLRLSKSDVAGVSQLPKSVFDGAGEYSQPPLPGTRGVCRHGGGFSGRILGPSTV
jgi:hypothetical protein